MLYIEILLISIGLAMDAFAVSICKGICMKKIDIRKCLIIGLYFGLFQALMPTIGYFLGTSFRSIVIEIDHYLAFILLSIIGINMIKDVFLNKESKSNDSIDFKTMIILAIATSIDALAIGITFSFFEVNLLLAVSSIGIITFILSFIGVFLGYKCGSKYEKSSKILGGSILIILGIKILIEHLNVF